MNLRISATPDVQRNEDLTGAFTTALNAGAFRTIPMATNEIAKSIVLEPLNGGTFDWFGRRGLYQTTLSSAGACMHWAKAVVTAKATKTRKCPRSTTCNTCRRCEVRGSGNDKRDFFSSAS